MADKRKNDEQLAERQFVMDIGGVLLYILIVLALLWGIVGFMALVLSVADEAPTAEPCYHCFREG